MSATSLEEAAAIVYKALADRRDVRVDIQILGELAALRAEVADLKTRVQPLIFTIPDAARVLGRISVPTVKRAIKDGELRTLKVRGRTLVDLTGVRGVDGAEVARLAAEIR